MRWLLAVAVAAGLTVPAEAQEAAGEAGPLARPDAMSDAIQEAPDAAADLPEAEGELSAEQLEDLIAPVALYPDALLSQILIAATYPLDVVKAGRLIDANEGADVKARSALVEAEDWDDSVKALASGFPDVVERMTGDIDWTEDLGDAMLAQSDDLLDAVQRLRAQAQAVGNLDSNEAQTVEEAEGDISIAPAQPDVVYVPAYDPVQIFTTPVTTAPAIYNDPGMSVGEVMTTGAIAFGSALLVNEIFDDEDDWDDDYWRHHRSIDWNDRAVYRRGVHVEGDVNIDVDRNRIVRPHRPVRIGHGDPDRHGPRWEADRERRHDAQRRIHAREAARHGAGRPHPPGGRDQLRSKAEARLKAHSGGHDLKAARDRAAKHGPPKRVEGPKGKALQPGPGHKHDLDHARARASDSLKRPQASHHKPHKAAPHKNISRPKSTHDRPKAAPIKTAKHGSALHKPKGGASRAKASHKRGGHSRHGRR